MGAGNAKKAYALWGDLPDGPLRLLVFMSLTALDADNPPTFHRGREALAVGMGRTVADARTTDPAEIAERRRAFKAVDRMTQALKDAGAITQLRPAGPGHAAVYALNLSRNRTPITGDHFDETHPDERGPNEAPADEKCTPVSGHNAPRSAGQRTPVSGTTHPGQRGPKEYRSLRTVLEEGNGELSPTSHPPRATAPSEPASVVELFPGVTGEAPYRSPPITRHWGRGNDAIAEAMERRAKARADHQTKLTAEEA